jgi:hypothetical protein
LERSPKGIEKKPQGRIKREKGKRAKGCV